MTTLFSHLFQFEDFGFGISRGGGSNPGFHHGESQRKIFKINNLAKVDII